MALTRTKKTLIIVGLLLGGMILLLGFARMSLKSVSHFMSSGGEDAESFETDSGDVAVLEIKGVIEDPKDTLKSLRELEDKKSIKALVVRIDSPGGAVAPSQEIYEAVKALRKTKKVVCSLGDLAASGGYYIAAACEKIVANPGTLTGSIGVIMQFMNTKELYTWAKLDPFVLKAGKYKDVGSPLRPMTEEERALLQNMLDDVHKQFKDTVTEGRGFKPGYIDTYGDGRIFTGLQAKELGFVDELGGESVAIKLAADMAGIKGKPRVVRETNRKDRLSRFFESSQNNVHEGVSSGITQTLEKLAPQLRLQAGVPYLLPAHMYGGRP